LGGGRLVLEEMEVIPLIQVTAMSIVGQVLKLAGGPDLLKMWSA
jgi:hypothetical protein